MKYLVPETNSNDFHAQTSAYSYHYHGTLGGATKYFRCYASAGFQLDEHTISGFDGTSWTSSYSDTSGTSVVDNGAMRIMTNGDIYAAYYLQINATPQHDLILIKSTDEGASWTSVNILTAVSASVSGHLCVDVFEIGANRYILTYFDTTSDVCIIYKDDGTASATINSVVGMTSGYISGGKYYFTIGTAGNTDIYEFDGTTATVFETISSTANYLTFTSKQFGGLLKKGNTLFLLTVEPTAPLTENKLWVKTLDTWKLTVNPKLNNTAFTYFQYYDSTYDVRFIVLAGLTGGSQQSIIYYITDGGYMIRLPRSYKHSQPGWGMDFDAGKMLISAIEPANEPKIHYKHLKAETLFFEYEVDIWRSGYGIVLYNDLETMRYIGYPDPDKSIIDTRDEVQQISFVSPAKSSLDRIINYSATAMAPETILTNILANDTFFLKNTFEATGITIDVSYEDKTLRSIIEDLENQGFKIFWWDLQGNCYFDDGKSTASNSGVTVIQNEIWDDDIANRGSKVNKIIVIGGIDVTNGRIARGEAILSSIEQDFNVVVYEMSNLKTDALCVTAATNLLTNIGTSVKQCKLSFFDDTTPLYPGQYINATIEPETALDFILEQLVFDLLNEIYERVIGHTALIFKPVVNTTQESNRDRISQNAGEIITKMNDLIDDTTPQLGGDLDMNGNKLTSSDVNKFYYLNATTIVMEEGVTEANVQAAIDALEAQGGGILFLPEGTINITSTSGLTVTQPIHFIGSGKGTKLQASGATSDYLMDCQTNCYLNGITFDQTGGKSTLISLLIQGSNTTVIGCGFYDQSSVSGTDYTIKITASSCHIIGNTFNGNDDKYAHIWQSGTTTGYCQISGNYFVNGSYAIIINGVYNTITGNTTNSFTSKAFYCSGDYNTFNSNSCRINTMQFTSTAANNICIGNTFNTTVTDSGSGNKIAHNIGSTTHTT